MTPYTEDTVLFVCDDEARSRELLARLLDSGLSVVGPASTAASAMALAAQTAPTVALVAGQPTGRRKAVELAQDLMDTWGIPTIVTSEACPNAERPSSSVYWAPRRSQRQRLEGVLLAGPAA